MVVARGRGSRSILGGAFALNNMATSAITTRHAAKFYSATTIFTAATPFTGYPSITEFILSKLINSTFFISILMSTYLVSPLQGLVLHLRMYEKGLTTLAQYLSATN